MSGRKGFWYKLFFVTKGKDDDELDLGWVLLLLAFIPAISIWVAAAFGVAKVTVAAWSFMGSLLASLLIAGIPIARARILANSKLPGEVAQGIATASTEPDLWKDDERGEHTEREPV